MLSAHVVRESDEKAEAALVKWQQGEVQQAISMLEAVLDEAPDNDRSRFRLVEILLETNAVERASAILEAVKGGARDSLEFKALAARVGLAGLVRTGAKIDRLAAELQRDPHNLELRFQLALCQVLAGAFDEHCQ